MALNIVVTIPGDIVHVRGCALGVDGQEARRHDEPRRLGFDFGDGNP